MVEMIDDDRKVLQDESSIGERAIICQPKITYDMAKNGAGAGRRECGNRDL
jgi:hypothetical protein